MARSSFFYLLFLLAGFAGTPGYLSPEVLRKDPYGKPVDVWACGRTAFNVPLSSLNGLTQHAGPEVIKEFSCSTQLSMKF